MFLLFFQWYKILFSNPQASEEGDAWFVQTANEIAQNTDVSGEEPDSWKLAFKLSHPLSRPPTRIFAECDWRSWGNSDFFLLKLLLLRRNERVAELKLPRLVSTDSWKHHTFDTEDGDFLGQIQAEDVVEVIGSGRSCDLYVQNFRLASLIGLSFCRWPPTLISKL